MSTERIEDVLDRCLARIAAGEDVCACLHDEPQHAEALTPLLQIALALRSLVPPDVSSLQHEVLPPRFFEGQCHLNVVLPIGRLESAVKIMQQRGLSALARIVGGRRGQSTP
jgi:hypothetical protein